jgi:DNA-binding NtrC family response regulator
MVVAAGITSEEVRSLGDSLSARAGRGPGMVRSLVVTGDRGLRSRLEAVAELSGWSACESPADCVGLSAAVEGDYQLVIVDITAPVGNRVNDSIELAEEFAGRRDTLLVICGSEDSVDEELWARQLGAWVYLPGVSSGDAFVSLFSDARRLAERRGVYQFA